MIYQIRLLVQCQVEANSFDEALIKASSSIVDGYKNASVSKIEWQFVGNNNKRYVRLDNGILNEVETFGKFQKLSVDDVS